MITLKRYIRYFLIYFTQLGLFLRKDKIEKTYVFHHLPRCGGTSLRTSLKALKNVYNDYRIGWGNLYPMKYNLSKFAKNDCLSGHFELEGKHLFQRYPEVFNNSRYILFSFIRNPLDLVISDFFYKIKKKQDIELDLKKYIFSKKNFLAGILNVDYKNYKNILDRYDFIGIFEEYDESLIRLAKLLKTKPLIKKNNNKEKKNDLINSLTKEDIARFKKYNELDYYIYVYCLKRFKKNK